MEGTQIFQVVTEDGGSQLDMKLEKEEQKMFVNILKVANKNNVLRVFGLFCSQNMKHETVLDMFCRKLTL